MKTEFKIGIEKKIGSRDGARLIEFLKAWRLQDDIQFYDRGLTVPVLASLDVLMFRRAISTLSRCGRTFSTTVQDNRLHIDTVAMQASILRQYTPRISWGISAEDMPLPDIPIGARVLDVGAGTGVIAERMKKTFACDVFALEPNPSVFKTCLEKLGSEKIEQMTLQTALELHPERYFQAFDVVCVFKYDVNFLDHEKFIRALSQVVKPEGVVYVTSVEPERFSFSRDFKSLYVRDLFDKYFGAVSIFTRQTGSEIDQLITSKKPTLQFSSEEKPIPQRNSLKNSA